MAGESRSENSAPPQEQRGSAAADTSLVASRYEIQELVGRGSMGAVYCARDVVLDRPVALKIFPAEAADARQAVRYEQEARLLARLSHPGLVTVYDAGIDATVADEPRPYLVMELVRGPTLADRLHVGPLPPAEVAALATQLSSALAHIHRRDVVHRDVKPANVLLRHADDGSPYPAATLTDFGIARLIDGTRITMTGHTLGTANYLSPEQLSGSEVGPPSDIYSLGLLLIECLTGEVVFPGHGIEAAMPRLHGAPTIPDTVPPEWAGLLRSMTDPDPGRRPAAADIVTYVYGLGGDPVTAGPPVSASDEPTIAAMPVVPPAALPVADVDQTRMLPAVATTSDAPQAASRHRRLRPALLLAALAGLLVLIFVIVYLISGNGSSATPSTPHYPGVSGPIGNHLRQLQKDVAP